MSGWIGARESKTDAARVKQTLSAKLSFPPRGPGVSFTRMKLLPRLLALVTALSLTGCFQIDKNVQVKPDGSGTITETITMGTTMIAQMKAMASGFGDPAGGAGGKAKEFQLLDETKLKEEAKKMGEGVTFVSAKKITAPDREGYTAIYAFTDVNKLKLSTNPPDIGGGGNLKMTSKADSEPVTFTLTKGKTAELTVTTPAMKPAAAKTKEEAAAEATQEAMSEAMLPMMQQMFKDMRMAMSVEVLGTITTTNATNKEGSKVTLLDVDFNKILADPAKMKAMTKIKDPNSAEAKAFLKTIPGMKVETVNPVKISFQ